MQSARNLYAESLHPRTRHRIGTLLREHRERGCGTPWNPATPCTCLCDDHPCSVALSEPPPVCAVCRDTGSVIKRGVPVDSSDFGRAVPCPECAPNDAAIFDLARRFSGGDPVWLDEYRLDTLDPNSEPRSGIERWMQMPAHQRQPFVTIAGPKGTGKTHGALAICRLLCDQGRYVHFTTAPDLLAELRASFDKTSSRSLEDIMRRPRAVDCLVVDDLGTEASTEWSYEQLYRVINERYMHRRTTVFTSNTSPWDAPSDRIWSRVMGERVARVIVTEGKDRRQL